MEDGAHRGPDGFGVVEVRRAPRESHASAESMSGADDSADVAWILNAAKQEDAVPPEHKLFGGDIEERKDGDRTGRCGERREPADDVGVGEEICGRRGGFFY